MDEQHVRVVEPLSFLRLYEYLSPGGLAVPWKRRFDQIHTPWSNWSPRNGRSWLISMSSVGALRQSRRGDNNFPIPT